MRKWIIIVGTLLLLPNFAKAQWYVEPLMGYQADLSNHSQFSFFNIGVQATLNKGKRYEFMIRVQQSIGFSHCSSDSSFTANPALPLYSVANKTMHPNAGYLSFDQRFKFRESRPGHQFSVLLLMGINAQRITVNYHYDKINYTILNPDETQKKVSLYIGTGLEYMRLLKNSRLFVQLTISSPPAARPWVPSSFSPMAPMAINAGYSLPLKRKKHEK